MKENRLEKELFPLHSVNPIVLAFMGDCVYEFAIRDYVIRKFPTMKIHAVHRKAVSFAKASSQANVVQKLHEMDFLTEEEWSWVKKGRNQHSMIPKNASPMEYRYATGFETLLGYLHFVNQQDRIRLIVEEAIKIVGV